MNTCGLQSPYVSLFHDAIKAAVQEKASDVHIRPTSNGVEILFRVFGLMTDPWKTLDVSHREAFINEVKRSTNLRLAVSGEPLDSRVTFPELQHEARVNLVPTHHGDKIVMRLFDPARSFSVDGLGLEEKSECDLLNALDSKNGVILVSGPTGSGKTTTLYSLVHALDRKKLNIVTIEDPIECSIQGVTQIGISRKLSFAKALRAILRQDPDVILVGEIRDEETAELCFKAASTGHLVLSTIHANDSNAVVQRLLGLGVEKYLIENCLRFSAAQRLAGKLCAHCSLPILVDALPKDESPKGGEFRVAGAGCAHCKQGYTGFLVLLEYMGLKEIRSLAESNISMQVAPKVSLKDEFYRHARKGLIDVTEVNNFV